MKELVIDEEIRSFNPTKLTDDEYKLLEQSLIDSGCLDPIKCWGNIIIDGYNRYEICTRHGIEFTTSELIFENRQEVERWVVGYQLGRRNLTPEKYAVQLARLYAIVLKQDSLGDTVSPNSDHSTTSQVSVNKDRKTKSRRKDNTAQKVADEAGTNKRSVMRAVEYDKALDKLDERSPGIKDDILSGKLKMTKKEVIKAAKALGDEPAAAPVDISVPKTPQEEIDDLLVTSMAAASEIQGIRAMLTSIGKSLKEIGSKPGGEILEGARFRIEADLKNVDRELRFAKPYATCPYCMGKLPKIEGCNGCNSTGWVNESVFKAAPSTPNPTNSRKAKLEALGEI